MTSTLASTSTREYAVVASPALVSAAVSLLGATSSSTSSAAWLSPGDARAAALADGSISAIVAHVVLPALAGAIEPI
ncbi:hypothetical protein HK405_006251, partial [Cladochytrium tenue]